jgi:hypothetical protein
VHGPSVMLMRRAFTVPKAPDIPNEDTFRFSPRKNTYALSDGASISYDSAAWSRIVATHYVQHATISRDWLDCCIAEFDRQHDRDNMPWHQQGAFDRGSFASLLGVRIVPETELQIVAIGDSLAVLCDGSRLASSFPYRTAQQFDDAPVLLSSERWKNPVFKDDMLSEEKTCVWSLHLLTSPRLYCMTDALGQWLLAQGGETTAAIERLNALKTRRAFERFVLNERDAKRLKRDDTTLLVFW